MPGDFVAVNRLGDKLDVRFGLSLYIFGTVLQTVPRRQDASFVRDALIPLSLFKRFTRNRVVTALEARQWPKI